MAVPGRRPPSIRAPADGGEVAWSSVLPACKRLGLWLVAVLGVACGSESEPDQARCTGADLRADVNRDGIVKTEGSADDTGEEDWSARAGAVFLANLDDDERRCDPTGLTDRELPGCNDAADGRVNGPEDELDLARLVARVCPGTSGAVGGSLTVEPTGRARLFKRVQERYDLYEPGSSLTTTELRQGVHFGLEGLDVVRDLAEWDGHVRVTLTVDTSSGAQTDTVDFRVAPVMLSHHLQLPEQVHAIAVPAPGSEAYRRDLRAAVEAAKVPHGLTLFEPRAGDQWAQDHYETGWTSLPAVGGPHLLGVALRSPHVDYFDDAESPLREAGRVVFEELRELGLGGIQAYLPGGTEDQQTLNSLGNLETVPPYSHAGEVYPLGRMIMGSTPEFHPDERFVTLLEAQQVQPLIKVDTSWLSVGHVDETMSFVKADTPRGWALVLADPRAAKERLERARDDGYGDAVLFEGMQWLDLEDFTPLAAETTIARVLADPEVMAASAEAAVEIDAQLEVLRAETGITEDEIIRVPALHFREVGATVAYDPATVNLTVLGDADIAVAAPHGPRIDGQDLFQEDIVEIFSARGIRVHFVEDWDTFHRLNGDVHCGNNMIRDAPGFSWWESGR